MFNKKVFRQFKNEEEVYEWITDNFEEWTRYIEIHENRSDKSDIANLLYYYTGNKNILYKRILWGCTEDFEKGEIEKHLKEISIITKEICKFELQENIIVYRYTYKNMLKKGFESLKIETGKSFTDKAFMSTTLVPGSLKGFSKSRKCDCILKLYLPKGTKGVYVSVGKNALNEQEFLLPPNSTFKLIRGYYSFKYHMTLYKCELLCQ
ncbi:ADP-ribosyltransferase [Clostridium sp. WILCCON 0269]|uniref:ADP-ribosyltransferase n=1 Tax=Candidatus Clostridium eludens TaxID=3381663 RepID=A0ABW8SM71_9CLOT